jgi:flagellar biosynthesis chaperone FliJ
MDRSKKKRFQRIESLDQKRLDASVVELKKLNQILEHRSGLRNSMMDHLNNLLNEFKQLDSVLMRNNSIAWAAKIQSSVEALDKHLVSLKQLRDERLDEVRQQQAKVKGWDLLLEKIKTEEQDSIEKENMATADDRVLGKLSGK